MCAGMLERGICAGAACADTGLFPSEESPGHMLPWPHAYCLFRDRQASRASRAEEHMTSDDGRGEHQMVLIIRKSGHIRGVTLCHGDVTTLSCGH